MQRLGRMPDSQEIAAEMGIDADEYEQGRAAAQKTCSLSECNLSDEFEEMPRALDESLATDDATLDRLISREALAGLPPKERRVLELIYVHGFSQVEIGRILGTHWNYVAQLKLKALRTLRGVLRRPAAHECPLLSPSHSSSKRAAATARSSATPPGSSQAQSSACARTATTGTATRSTFSLAA